MDSRKNSVPNYSYVITGLSYTEFYSCLLLHSNTAYCPIKECSYFLGFALFLSTCSTSNEQRPSSLETGTVEGKKEREESEVEREEGGLEGIGKRERTREEGGFGRQVE